MRIIIIFGENKKDNTEENIVNFYHVTFKIIMFKLREDKYSFIPIFCRYRKMYMLCLHMDAFYKKIYNYVYHLCSLLFIIIFY